MRYGHWVEGVGVKLTIWEKSASDRRHFQLIFMVLDIRFLINSTPLHCRSVVGHTSEVGQR